MEIIGNIIIFIGALFMLFGIIGLFKFNNFYTRILVAAIIDTMGAISVVIGLAVKHGFGFFSLKLVLLVVIMLVINPFIANTLARSAFLSGHKLEGEAQDMDDGGKI